MGFNKAFVEIDGCPLVERIADRARILTDEVLICTDDPEPYTYLNLPIVSDLFSGHGPLAGLHAAFLNTNKPLVLLVGCDLPNVTEELWLRLVECADGFDAVIPKTSDGGVHPLCAVYRQTCMPILTSNLRNDINKVVDLFRSAELRVKWLDRTEGRFDDEQLDNLNTPEDLARFLQRRNLLP